MTGRCLRVLLVSHYYPPHLGGIENVVHEQAKHLARRGVDGVGPDGGDPDQHLTRAGRRDRQVHLPEHFWSAVAVGLHCTHVVLLCRFLLMRGVDQSRCSLGSRHLIVV